MAAFIVTGIGEYQKFFDDHAYQDAFNYITQRHEQYITQGDFTKTLCLS